MARASRGLQRELLDDFTFNLGRDLTRIHREFAPHDSGRLRRRIRATVISRGGRIRITMFSDVRDPESGYAYTPVTRFGHRKPIIYPVRAKALSWVDRSGRRVFRAWVRGYRPASDWVADARPTADRAVARAADRIGRQVVSRLL